MWKVWGEVVPDGLLLEPSEVRMSETSSLSPKSKVRPELGVFGYVWAGLSPSFSTGNNMGSLSLRLTTT